MLIGSDQGRVLLILGILLIVIGAMVELFGFVIYLHQQSAYREAQDQAERAGLGNIPGVGAPDLLVLIGPLFLAGPLVAAGVILILKSRDNQR